MIIVTESALVGMEVICDTFQDYTTKEVVNWQGLRIKLRREVMLLKAQLRDVPVPPRAPSASH